jgi:hypothetical protein
MQIRWILREWLKAKHGLTRPTDISKIIYERTGYRLSLQAISELLQHQPKMLRLETIQAICGAFDCRLSEFCEVLPYAIGQCCSEDRFAVPSARSMTPRVAQANEPQNIQHEDSSVRDKRVPFAAALYPNARLFSSHPAESKTNLHS